MPTHSLPTLPAGTEILIDANVIVYAVNVLSAQCRDVLRRCGT